MCELGCWQLVLQSLTVGGYIGAFEDSKGLHDGQWPGHLGAFQKTAESVLVFPAFWLRGFPKAPCSSMVYT